jgi:L-amino acid N-acyltransferase
MKTIVQQAIEDNLPGILTIYNEVIINSTAVYSLEASTLEERRNWFAFRRSNGFPHISRAG